MYDLVIIGAGPAGISAGIYAVRRSLKTIILEKASVGGQMLLTNEIENWPGFEETVSAPELMQSLRKQAERFGAEFAQDEVVRIETFLNEDNIYIAKPVGRSEVTADGGRWADCSGSHRIRKLHYEEYVSLRHFVRARFMCRSVGRELLETLV